MKTSMGRHDTLIAACDTYRFNHISNHQVQPVQIIYLIP